MNSKLFKIIFYIFLVLLLFSGIILYKFQAETNAKRLYAQGMELFNQKKYSDAYFNFKKMKSISKLYQLSILKQFQCANYLEDKKTSKNTLKELTTLIKDKNLRAYVLYNAAIVALEQDEDKQLLYKRFNYIYKNYQNTDFAYASAYHIAQIVKTVNVQLAKEKYVEYLSFAPIGRYSQNAILSLFEFSNILKCSDWEILADSCFKNQKYELALKAYQNAYFSKNWFNISKCYRNLKKYNEEKETIIKGFDLYLSEVNEKDILSALQRYVELNKINKIQTLQDLYTKYSSSYIHPTITYELAENLNSIRSIKLYEYIYEKYPASIWASNSIWEVFWYNFKQKRYKVCETLARKHIDNYSSSKDAPRIAYWYAKVLLIEKKNQPARELFYKVLANYPTNYYAFLSAKQLKASKAKKIILKKQIPEYNFDSLNSLIFQDEMLNKLAKNKDWQTIDDLKLNDNLIKSKLMFEKGSYPESIQFAKDELEKNEIENKLKYSDFRLKLVWPILFEDLINHYSKENQLSPYLLLSLIREESHFNKNAKSPVGALGLAQVMPSTASFVEKKSIPNNELLKEEKNIEIGAKYFKYLIDYFKGNEYLAILAYNAGPGNVNKWLNGKDIEQIEIDDFVENVPFLETKNYIKKILASYWVYLNIYSTKNK